MKTRILLLSVLTVILFSCKDEKSVPADLIKEIQSSYKPVGPEKGLFNRKPKLSEVKEPTQEDPVTLPTWITNKKYISENADAIKYSPELLIGALARTYEDGRFEIYSVTYNIRNKDELPTISKIEKPTNFYEKTFDSKTRFNSDFLIGGATVSYDEMIKVTYTETNYGNLQKYDEEKLANLKKIIQDIPGANLKDWSIVRGVVITDCTYTKNKKAEADASVKASWISANSSFYMQNGTTDNFRLISIDLENLFL